MLGRGEFAHLVLITKIKATEITCCFVPKEQIQKYSFSMHWKCFHALNCSEEVNKMSVSVLKRSERTSRQQATEAAAVLPWFPPFNFLRAAGATSTHQRPQGITSSSCFGEEIKRMWAVPQEPQCNTEAPILPGFRQERTPDPLWEGQVRVADLRKATEKPIPTQMSRGSACDLLNRTIPLAGSQHFLKEAFFPSQARASL